MTENIIAVTLNESWKIQSSPAFGPRENFKERHSNSKEYFC